MRKFNVIILSALMVLGLSSFVWAEMSATAYSGKSNNSQQVFVDMYNNSGIKLSENTIAIIDSNAGLTDAKVGAYFTVATTSDSVYAVGVLDQDVASASVGRVCVRGPHKLQVTTESAMALGSRIGTANTTSRPNGLGFGVIYTVADGTAGSRVGVAIGEQQATPTSIWWIWVDPYAHQ
jgi:hypothetical protein